MLRPAPSHSNSEPEKIAHMTLQELQSIHDSLSAQHSVFHGILSVLEQLSGQVTMLATRYQEANGVPRGQHISVQAVLTAANQVYSSPPLIINGTIRNLMISGPGNVKLWITNPNVSSIPANILTIACNNIPTESNMHFKVGVGYILSISTDSTSTASMACTAWIEPAAIDADNQYIIRDR